MKLTGDERRALAFIAALLFVSAAVRLATLPEPVEPPGGGFDLDGHIAATARLVEEEERRATPLAPGERLDPNTAPAVELARLPGIGPAMAERIAADRETGGLFRSADDLLRVPGIGPRTLDRIRDHVTLPRGTVGTTDAAGAARAVGAGGAGSRVRAGAGAGAVERGGGGEGGRGERVVDLNRADAAALVELNGIGPVLAERIVAYRDSVGGFRTVEDLLAVRGVGPSTLERLRPWIRVR